MICSPLIEPLEWRPTIYSSRLDAIFYRASPFLYSIIGLLLLVPSHNVALQHCDQGFYWSAFGLGLILQGFVSYMGDVATWGRQSRWKQFDLILAPSLTFIAVPTLALRGVLGVCRFPSGALPLWVTAGAVSIACKAQSAKCLSRPSRSPVADAADYMFWHGLWHCLPLYGALILVFVIVPGATRM